jgi:hypothetical protein
MAECRPTIRRVGGPRDAVASTTTCTTPRRAAVPGSGAAFLPRGGTYKRGLTQRSPLGIGVGKLHIVEGTPAAQYEVVPAVAVGSAPCTRGGITAPGACGHARPLHSTPVDPAGVHVMSRPSQRPPRSWGSKVRPGLPDEQEVGAGEVLPLFNKTPRSPLDRAACRGDSPRGASSFAIPSSGGGPSPRVFRRQPRMSPAFLHQIAVVRADQVRGDLKLPQKPK